MSKRSRQGVQEDDEVLMQTSNEFDTEPITEDVNDDEDLADLNDDDAVAVEDQDMEDEDDYEEDAIDAYFEEQGTEVRNLETQLYDLDDMVGNNSEGFVSDDIKALQKPPSVWSLFSDSERKEIDARAEATSLIMEAVPDLPSDEKLRKIALKRATARVTRPPSSFIVFSTKRRAELPTEMSFKEKAQLISQEYKNLSEDQKAELDAACSADRKAYELRLEQAIEEELSILKEDPAAGMATRNIDRNEMKNLKFHDIRHSKSIAFPLAKIKRIIKLNPEVKNISKEASILIAKTSEFFLSYVGLKCIQNAALRNGKSIQERDFMHIVHTQPICDFLREDFPKRAADEIASKGGNRSKAPASHVSNQESAANEASTVEDKTKLAKTRKMAAAAAGTSNIAGFFGQNTA